MNHVCVSYPPCFFGDWLRLFISYHEGFQKFEYVSHFNSIQGFWKYDLWPFKKIKAGDMWSVECFEEEFEKILGPTVGGPDDFHNNQWTKIENLVESTDTKNQRIVWKIVQDKMHGGHSLFEIPRPTKTKSIKHIDYNIIRQTDHLIIFVKINPNSEIAEIVYERIKTEANNRGFKLVKEDDQKKSMENYFNLDFPKHKLNYEIELNKIFEYDENAYNKLCNFIKVKPLDSWRDYIDEFQRRIFQK